MMRLQSQYSPEQLQFHRQNVGQILKYVIVSRDCMNIIGEAS